jgi:predicted nucleotidyltransferase
MVCADEIISLADRIAREFNPEKIILFGSYASGSPSEDSDVDLMVVMPYRGPSYSAASRVRIAINVRFPLDVIVRSPAELIRRLAMNDFFLMDIVEQRLVLHDANDCGMGQQGRKRLRRRLHFTQIPKIQPI